MRKHEGNHLHVAIGRERTEAERKVGPNTKGRERAAALVYSVHAPIMQVHHYVCALQLHWWPAGAAFLVYAAALCGAPCHTNMHAPSLALAVSN